MCGIAGVKYKNGPGPVGRDLLEILIGINHRGPDSAGMATYTGQPPEGVYKMRLRLDLDPTGAAVGLLAERVLGRMAELGVQVEGTELADDTYLINFTYEGDLRTLANDLIDLPGVQIQSVGRTLEITKAVGPCTELDRRFGVAGDYGSHGIGHVRLATESRIMVSTSHPFWAFGFADVAVVHNGQLTNYHKLRRRLENRGWKFTTANDTELIAVYVADKLAQEYDLACAWDGDVLRFERSGVDGSLTLEKEQAQLQIKLGFMLSAFASTIEGKIAEKMRKVFTEPG